MSDVKQGNLLDLSGGGMRFQTRAHVEYGDLLDIKLELPTGDIHSVGGVCRAVKNEESDRFSISVEFNDITERERDRIVRCVFDLQRMMRRKGLV